MNILLASRDSRLSTRLRQLLRRLLGIRVVGQTSTGRGAILLARKKRPAVALIGSSLRGPGCLETVRAIKTIRPRTQFIVLTVRHTKAYVRAARRSGANYCLPVRTLEVRLPSLLVLAYRDYLVAAARSVPRAQRGRRGVRTHGR
jgi:DNA-binding NarL/FixJ family response regulator